MLASLEQCVVSKAIRFPCSLLSTVICTNNTRLFSQRHQPQRYQKESKNLSLTTTTSGGGDKRRGYGGGGRGRGKHYPSSLQKFGPSKVTNSFQESQDKRTLEMMKMNITEYRQEFRREIQEYGDPMDEPDPNTFSKTFTDYVKDEQHLKYKIKANRMTKKHYRDQLPREMCFLTFAERENIKYLCETDPEEWTPEAISECYPISPQGVNKLLRSSLKFRRIKDVVEYDKAVQYKVKLVKEGKIPMTEEMEKRLKIRDAVPLRVGDLGVNLSEDQFVESGLPKKLGQWASMVAPPALLKAKGSEEDKGEEPVVKFGKMKDGEFYWEEGKVVEGEELPQQLSKEQLGKILPVKKRMTFNEFEKRIERKGGGEMAGDMKYMLGLHVNKGENTGEIELEEGDMEKLKVGGKFKKLEEGEKGHVTLNVEGGQGYLYEDSVGYQKPFDGSSPERISIPEDLWRPGATYKVGDCYYDEDGEFLYRVL